MAKNQQTPDFGYGTAFLENDERAHVVKAMERCGAKHSGCLLLQAPLWILFILAVVACLLIYSALQAAHPPTALSMLALGSLIPIGIDAARKWILRMYYRRPIVIGARSPHH